MIRSFCVNYCDDIRHEVGNKISLIGLYGGDLVVAETPAVIPKLCIFVQIYGEIDTPFEDHVEIKIMLDDNEISSTIGSHEVGATLKPEQFHSMRFQFIMTPFVIEKECKLRVRAYYKDQECKAAALHIKTASPDKLAASKA